MPKAMTLKRKDIDTAEKRRKYTIGILGHGQKSLTHACLFANAGFKVVYADADHNIANQIEKGKISSSTQQINALLNNHIRGGRLAAERSIRKATSASDIIISSIPATINKKEKPDYSRIATACKEAGLSLSSGHLFISTSITGPGVTEGLVKETLENASGLKAGKDFGLAYSPISKQVLKHAPTDKIVVGATDERSLQAACLVLDTVTTGRIVTVRDIRTAETAKLFEKIYEDVNIALTNELASFCEKAGIDIIEAQKALNKNPHQHLSLPQLIGGHAMASLHLLNDEAEALNTKLRLVALAGGINEGMVNHAVRLVKDALRACGKNLRRAKISVFGVSCRRNTRETERSLVKKLVEALKRRGGHVSIYDSMLPYGELVEMGYPTEMTLTKTVEKSDCLIIAVGHDRFRRLNLRRIKFLMKKPAAIVDMGRVIDPDKAEKEGFVYRGVGRGVWTR
ncbi:MAG: nucleotide sugar dehydrogenase [Candidatus Bathyarchaeia archaeon]